MAFQAKRRKQFIEDFELVNENGEIVHTIQVSLDADDMIAKIHRKYTELTRVMVETTEIKRKFESAEVSAECLEKLGVAVVDLLEAVFGAEDTQTIVGFYENRYIEMAQEVIPFITSCVIPRCQEIKKENQKSILQSYNRHQRRFFTRKGH